jgi:4-amino-4-deoxy-L-arabinose transferase-like glycosyltransferase
MNPRSQAPIISPALVTQKAVQRLPRWALLLFCAAYVIPGLLGRDPWKNDDIASFGHMWSLALGQASWLHPNVGGILPASGGVLPYWLGGAFISLLGPWVDPALAARIPFALLLSSVLALTWYTTYQLALTDAAQPLPLAFGGEAKPRDYARAVADGALLALIASLGLLQLGHETTPELLQLTGATLFLYSLAGVEHHRIQARWAAALALPILAASGSPTVAAMLGAMGLLVCLRSRRTEMRAHLRWILLGLLLALGLASALTAGGLSGWSWRLAPPNRFKDLLQLLLWFTWPTLPLAALTVWHWRRQVWRRHIAVPLLAAVVALITSLAMGGNERALLTVLPPLAVLAAFALPILQRSLGSALDWFSVIFFTLFAGAIWLIYFAMHRGVPVKIAANVAKLVPGIQPHFSWLALLIASAGTVLWLALVRWRTARQAHALWKSLVLPAGGVALCWLLFMTLWLPLLDQARSYRLLLSRITPHIPQGAMVCAPGAPVGLLTALEYFGGYRVNGIAQQAASLPASCQILVLRIPAHQAAPYVEGWRKQAQYNQRTHNSEQIVVYQPSSARAKASLPRH